MIEGNNFVEKLNNLHKLGWVKSRRRGNTGIGKTLEDFLGIPENNKKIPDLKFAELKTHRTRASNLVTLFTYDKGVWKIRNAELIKRFGYWDEEKARYALYQTVTSKENSLGLYTDIRNNSLFLLHNSGVTLGQWHIDDLANAFLKKMPNLVIVFAESRMINNIEEFWYNEAYYLEGVSEEKFVQLLEDDTIVLDIRMHLKTSGVARNHGTGFRINDKYLHELFASKINLLESDIDDFDFGDDEQKPLDDYLP